MPSVTVREHEHIEKSLKRLKKILERDRTFQDLKDREFYEKPSQIRKRKKNAAIKRWQRKVEEGSLDYQLKKSRMKKKEEREKAKRQRENHIDDIFRLIKPTRQPM